jgi:hypothetical protein
MHALRYLIGWSMALVLAVLALPAAAASSPDKLFSLTATPGVLAAGASNVAVTVTLVNQSPKSGNSIINSLKMQVPAGVAFTVSSITTVNGGTSSAGGAAFPTAGNGGTTISVNGITGVKPSGKLVVTLLVSVPPTATCSAGAWVGAAWAGNSFNGDPFAPYPNADSNVAAAQVGCDGILACGDSFRKPANLGPDDPGYAASTRSVFNKDGTTTSSGCVAVPYSFANTILSTDPAQMNKVNLKWLVQPTAVFTTSTNSQLRPVDASLSARRPKVAWLHDPSGNPVFVDGQACLGTNPPTNVPAPYGTLVVALDTDPATITIDGSAGLVPLPASGSFPLVIGTERMMATFVSAGTYSVTRAEGGTGPAAPHPAGAVVMSTPLPLQSGPFDANQAGAGYVVNNQAQMCVQEYGLASGGADAAGNPLVYDFTTVIDIGDGWISQ